MGIFDIETSSGGSSEVPPEGNNPAVLVGLIDLGTHYEEYQGSGYDARKVLLLWELPTEMMSSGKPHIIGKQYNLSEKVGPKSGLRKDLESWRGKAYGEGEKVNIASLIGKACLLNLGHRKSAKGNTFAQIMGIGPLPKGMSPPSPFTIPYVFELGEGPLKIPDWVPYLFGRPIEDVIGDSKELGGGKATGKDVKPEPVGAGVPGNGAVDDDIPF